MTRSELAVWTSPGEAPLRGKVTKRGSEKAAVTVLWDTGREEKVKAGHPHVRYAFEGTRRLDWLLHPELLVRQFRSDPVGVFVDVIHDEGKTIQTASIKRRIVDLGLSSAAVDQALKAAQPALRSNRHIVINGGSHTWSDVPVDPWAATRTMDPYKALEQLLSTKRFKPGEKDALADAVRAGLSARR